MIQNEVLSAIAARRSCRAYQPEQIKPEELQAVVEAGTWAPTAMNRQSPIIVAVQDKATRDRLSALNAQIMGRDGDPFYGAPTVLVVLADRHDPYLCGGWFPGTGQPAAGGVQHRAGFLLDQSCQRNL